MNKATALIYYSGTWPDDAHGGVRTRNNVFSILTSIAFSSISLRPLLQPKKLPC